MCCDYGKFFNACDKANGQIKNRTWPHKHGGRGKLGERGRFSSFAFGIVLQNTFNAFRDIGRIDCDDCAYYHCGESLVTQLYEYTDTLSADTLA